jgi:hypothetical protein
MIAIPAVHHLYRELLAERLHGRPDTGAHGHFIFLFCDDVGVNRWNDKMGGMTKYGGRMMKCDWLEGQNIMLEWRKMAAGRRFLGWDFVEIVGKNAWEKKEEKKI